MLAQSRQLNPQCEHLVGDMRSLRLGRTFDAVLVHDAVMYLTSEEDLRGAMDTASAHLRRGGVALFAADCTRETFHPATEHGGKDGDGRALRYLEWTWDPDPADTTFVAEFAYLLREGTEVRAVQDRHVQGLFPCHTWRALLAAAGFDERPAPRADPGTVGVLFLGVRR